MENTENAKWSKQLVLLTREALHDLPVTSDGCLHFKHSSLGFSYAKLIDLLDLPIILRDKDQGTAYTYQSIDILINAGWVLD